jgi:hypothetical protein
MSLTLKPSVILRAQKRKKSIKIFPVILHLNNKFQKWYLPNQDISNDKSLIIWKGSLSFKQYLPVRESKFGIKTYALCEATTGYLWYFLVCTGKDTKLDSPMITGDINKTTATVLILVEPLLKQG